LVSTSIGAYCVYEIKSAIADTYDYLYNGFAVEDIRGVAPEGWHVPSDDEIMELEMYLGMSENVVNETGFRGINEGSKLAGKENLWTDGALESDIDFSISGFSFLPGGKRGSYSGSFANINDNGYFWSMPLSNSNSMYYRILNYSFSNINRNSDHRINGHSVRCVKD